MTRPPPSSAAAYRSGELLVDDRLAMEFDFRGKAGVEHSEVLPPAGAPPSYQEREDLWNAAERAEGRKDAVPARELLLALLHELDVEQRCALVRDFVERQITLAGMGARSGPDPPEDTFDRAVPRRPAVFR